MDEVLLIAGGQNPVLADYATHCVTAGRRIAVIAAPDVCRLVTVPAERHPAQAFSAAAFHVARPARRVSGVVIFLDRRLTQRHRALLEEVVAAAREGGAGCVCVVSSFRVHFGDRAAVRAEAFLLRRLRPLPTRVVVLRPSHVLSRHSRLGVLLRDAWFWFALLPRHLQGCSVDGADLFAAIDQELGRRGAGRWATYTLLGSNLSWQDRMLENQQSGLACVCVVLAQLLPALALLRHVAGLIFDALARRTPPLQPLHLDTIRPRSFDELLALYNRHNYRHVKVVGYNNGVVHFGQQHPGKTVVSTVGCNRLARVNGQVAKFDAGVTIRQAMDVLGPRGQELPVLPNYSYVSLGTAYFIPIHGSASQFTTVADTIDKVVLYEPTQERVIVARRGDPAFGHYLYNLAANILLLRLYVRTKEKARYYVKQHEAADPSSAEVLGYFHDPRPTNVEVRKAGSAARTVKVSQFYAEPTSGDGTALELPRDAIGRLWDRLEENPVTSFLFHALTRWLGYHVELFLSEDEFKTFWETHREVPILKIQLRFIRRDGFPNSPFRQHDCVSADLFLHRKDREAFTAYLSARLPRVQMNPGKHSR
jgi:hypothetical protein